MSPKPKIVITGLPVRTEREKRRAKLEAELKRNQEELEDFELEKAVALSRIKLAESRRELERLVEQAKVAPKRPTEKPRGASEGGPERRPKPPSRLPAVKLNTAPPSRLTTTNERTITDPSGHGSVQCTVNAFPLTEGTIGEIVQGMRTFKERNGNKKIRAMAVSFSSSERPEQVDRFSFIGDSEMDLEEMLDQQLRKFATDSIGVWEVTHFELAF